MQAPPEKTAEINDYRYLAEKREYHETHDHKSFGFVCLHHVCSEEVGNLEIYVKNKTCLPGSVRVRTIDGGAGSGDDFLAVDKILEFQMGEEGTIVKIPILDDDAAEDDEDFFVELADAKTGKPLRCADTRTRVTIIDNDVAEDEQEQAPVEQVLPEPGDVQPPP